MENYLPKTMDSYLPKSMDFSLPVTAGSAMPEGHADMLLNRPFIYGITAQNRSLLFVGVCENPIE